MKPIYDLHDEQTDNKAKAKWMLSMLADPATGEIPKGVRSKELAFLHELQNDNEYRSKATRADTWNIRGPWNVGGRTRAFAIDVKNENHLIAAGVSGGIWQSEDGGKTWERATEPNTYAGVISITQDPRPNKTNIWYALTGELSGNSAAGGGAFYLGDGVLRSTDNGNTWMPTTSTSGQTQNSFIEAYQAGWRIAASPIDTVSACVYMATYGSIYRSIDTGNSWKIVLGAGNNSYYTDIAISSTGIVYATLSNDGDNTKGFFRSSDGINFKNITPAFLSNMERTVLEINPNDENEVYFLSHLSKDSSGGVVSYNYEKDPEYVALTKYKYISGDGTGNGGAWTNLSVNLPVTSPNQFDKFNCQGGYDLTIRCQPNTKTILIGGTNLYRSTDGFATALNTQQIGGYALATQLLNFGVYPNHHPDQHDIHFLKSNPKKLYSLSDGGIHYTDDVNASNVEWENKSLGYITTQLYSVAINEHQSQDQTILGGFQDNGNFITKSNKKESNWGQTVNGDGAYNYIAPNHEFYVISTQQGNVRKVKLDDKGNMMIRRKISPEGFEKGEYNFINNLCVDKSNSDILYMPIGKRMARLNGLKSLALENNDNKLTTGWTISTDTITSANNGSNGSILAEISVLALSQTGDNRLYFGTNNREIYRVDNAHQGELKFKKLGLIKLPVGGYVSGIAIDPDSSKNVLISYSNYNIQSLFYSSDTGNTWSYVGGNLEANQIVTNTNPSVRCVNILKDENGKRIYFAGTSIGLFSTDTLVLAQSLPSNKTVWKQESPNQIGASVVTDIRIRQQDGYLAIGTHGNGIFDNYYTGKTKPIANIEASSNSVYPNPASTSIWYTFSAQKNAETKIRIHNMQGQIVKQVQHNSFREGNFSLQIDVSNLPTGHYFISPKRKDDKRSSDTKHFIILR